MLHTKPSQGKKSKSTSKGSARRKPGNPKNDLLASQRSKKSDGGKSIDSHEINPIETKSNELEQSELNVCLKQMINSVYPPAPKIKNEEDDGFNPKILNVSKKNQRNVELIEEIEFKNGSNTIVIRLDKLKNNMYRLSIWMNDETEVRPVTYSGKSTGMAFWKLLKGSLKV